MNQIVNCCTLSIKHGPSAAESEIRIADGIEVFDYRFANGGVAKFAFVGGKSALTGGSRRQLRLADRVCNTLQSDTRSKASAAGAREEREVNLMVEAQFIEMRDGSKFFGVSENWHRRPPQGHDSATWMDNFPTEAYVMVIGQHNRFHLEDGTVLEEGYTEKYGEVFGQVQLVRVRLGVPAKIVLVGEDGSEAAYKLTFDGKSVTSEEL